MTVFGVCWVSSSGETSLVLGTSAQLVLGDVTGGTEILRPLELFPQQLEILPGQPKETIECFPFPQISMLHRLQMAQRAHGRLGRAMGSWVHWEQFSVKMFPLLEALPCWKSRDTPLTLAFPDCRPRFCMDLALCVRELLGVPRARAAQDLLC